MSVLPASVYCDGCGCRLVEPASLAAGRCESCRTLVASLRAQLVESENEVRQHIETIRKLEERLVAIQREAQNA